MSTRKIPGSKAGRYVRLTTYHLLVPNVKKIQGLNLPDLPWACSGLQRDSFTLLYFTLLYFTLLYFTLLYFTLLYFTFRNNFIWQEEIFSNLFRSNGVIFDCRIKSMIMPYDLSLGQENNNSHVYSSLVGYYTSLVKFLPTL
jgi:hypothetical protein